MTTTCQMAVLENRSVAKDIYLLSLQGTEEIEAHPGQFASLSVPGFFLRRPLGIVSSEKGKVTFLYKALGEGTKRLSEMKPGESLDVLLETDAALKGARGSRRIIMEKMIARLLLAAQKEKMA